MVPPKRDPFSTMGVALALLMASPSLAQNEILSAATSRSIDVAAVAGNSGAMTYSYRVPLLGGRAGLTPSLVLQYNSFARADSPYGTGWSDGSARIERESRKGAVQFGGTAFLYVVGGAQRELACESSTCDGNYRLKVDDGSFLKFRFDGTSWRVLDKTGLTHTFGATAAERQDDPSDGSRVFAWALSRTMDRSGNTIDYSYAKAAGQIYLASISYTGRPGASDPSIRTPNHRVAFSLVDAPAARPSYRTGFAVWTNKRVSRIDVFTNEAIGGSTPVAGYKLAYQGCDATSCGPIETISRLGANGSQPTPPTRFKYHLGEVTYGPRARWETPDPQTQGCNTSYINNVAATFPPLLVGDFTSDGRADIAESKGWDDVPAKNGNVCLSDNPDKWRIRSSSAPLPGYADLSIDSSRKTWRRWRDAPFVDTVMTGDFDGDGKVDIANATPGGSSWQISMNRGVGFGTSDWSVGAVNQFVEESCVVVGDFDGDGTSDIASAAWGLDSWQISLSARTSFLPPQSWSVGANLQLGEETHRAVAGDFDGDGRTDIAYLVAPGGAWLVSRSRGTFFENATWSGPDVDRWNDVLTSGKVTEQRQVLVGDFNGDGKTDLRFVSCAGTSCRWQESLSTGTGFAAVREWTTTLRTEFKGVPTTLVVGDFDGDGRADVALTGESVRGWSIEWGGAQPGLETYFDTSPDVAVDSVVVPSPSLGAAVYALAADIDGDGRDEIVTGQAGQDHFNVVGAPAKPGLGKLYEITNEEGGVTSVTYGLSSDYALPSDVSWPPGRLPFPVTVVGAISERAGPSLVPGDTTHFLYGDGHVDPITREFAGFHQVKRFIPYQWTVLEKYYQADRMLLYRPTTGGFALTYDYADYRGKPYSVRTTSWSDPNQYVETTLNWSETTPASASSPRFAFLRSREVSTKKGDGSTEGTIEIFTYDGAGNLAAVHQQPSAGTALAQAAEPVTTTFGYEQFGEWTWRLTRETATGNATGKVRESTYGYYPEGGPDASLLWWEEAWLAGGANPRTEVTYSAAGVVSTIRTGSTDLLAKMGGRTTALMYDPTSTWVARTILPSTTGSRGPSTPAVNHELTRSISFTSAGRKECAVDENGNRSCLVSDALGRPSASTAYAGAPSDADIVAGRAAVAARTEWQYSPFSGTAPASRLVRMSARRANDPSEHWISVVEFSDGHGRVTDAYEMLDATSRIHTAYSYDRVGRVTTLVGPFVEAGRQLPLLGSPRENLPVSASRSSRWIQRDYLGRPTTVTRQHASAQGTTPLGTSEYSYDGLWTTTSKDEDGRQRRSVVDSRGRVVSSSYLSGSGATLSAATYTYNAAGDLLTITDGRSKTTRITPDTLGRQVRLENPDVGVRNVVYDGNGNLESQTDAKQQRIKFTYDELGRGLTRVCVLVDPASGLESGTPCQNAPQVVNRYDDPSVPHGVGRLASTIVTDGAAALTAFRVHAYDALGRATEVGRSIAGAPDAEYVTRTEYDAAGRLATVRYPTTGGAAGLLVGYQYHEGTSQLERISDGASRTYAQFTAYELGGPGRITYGDGSVLTDFTYNPQSAQLDGLVSRRASAMPGDRAGEVLNHVLAETPEGDLTDLWDAQAGFRLKLPSAQQTHYAYDEAHRMRGERLSPATPGATAPTPFTVTLDPAAANRILSVNAAGAVRSFSHDANGNTKSSWDLTTSSQLSRTFEYDAFDRPTRITTGAAVASFAYDEEGVTIRKTSATEVVFRPGEHFEVVNGQAHASIFANGMRIATVVGNGNGNEIRYYHRDRLGSVVAVTNAAGAVTWRGSYNPFGAILEESGPLTSADVRYLFAGYRYDSDVRLYDLGARWYDPGIGRFTTHDPLLFPDPSDPLQLNGYSYTRNNPVNRVDPSGLEDVGISWLYAPSPWVSSSSSTPITESAANAWLADIEATAGGNLHPSCLFSPSSFPGQATAMRDTLRGLGELRLATSAAQWVNGDWGSAAVHYALAHVAWSLSEYYNPNWSPPLITGGLNVKVPGPAIQGGAAKVGGASGLKWGNPKSTPTYGHTFSEHGAQNTKGLVGEAGGTGRAQGQWLNNDAAAKFLAEQRPKLNGPASVRIPRGLGRVVNPDGSFSPASRATLVPSANGGFRTAYPIP